MDQAPKKPLPRPKARQFWKSARGRKLKARYRAEYAGKSNPKNLGRTGPGRRERGDSPAVPSWKIGRSLVSGNSLIKTAELFGMKETTVTSRAKSLGLAHGTEFLYDQGRPFRDSHLISLRDISGLPATRFEDLTELRRRSSDKRRGDTVRSPDVARKAVAWRQETIRILCNAVNDKGRPYKNHEIIKTLLPDLLSLKMSLAETFSEVQTQLREHYKWTIEDIWAFVCEAMQRECSGDGPWRKTFGFLWQIESFLAARLGDLRTSVKLSRFLDELLADWCGTTHWTIHRALYVRGVRTIAPAEMCGILLLTTPTPVVTTSAKIKKKPGRPPRDVLKEADRLQREQKWEWSKIAEKLDPQTFRHNPKAARNAIRQGVIRLRRKATIQPDA